MLFGWMHLGRLKELCPEMNAPLCFILIPFGKKPAGDGRIVDFDAVYEDIINPAVQAAGLEPLRADEEMVGGIIHKAMFEHLILCEYAVVDLTTANVNVFYELGVRHAARSWATVPVFAAGWGALPFDVNGLRAVPYQLGADGLPADAGADGTTLTARLRAAQADTDRPVFQLLEEFPDIQRLKTDVFRNSVRYDEVVKTRLAMARKQGEAELVAIEADLGDIARAEAGVVVDLFLSYRAEKAWGRMIDLVGRMAPPLAASVLVREQLGLALNRAGRGDEAEAVLLRLIDERGASSETCGILGRVYKDRWEIAVREGRDTLAQGLLDKAIDAYLKGFEADWRDAYPGVNAVTLMELREPRDPRQVGLLQVVAYAVERRIAAGKPDYWDYASRMELAVLECDEDAARAALAAALAHGREAWEQETTARNLRLIGEKRAARGEDTGLIGFCLAGLAG